MNRREAVREQTLAVVVVLFCLILKERQNGLFVDFKQVDGTRVGAA